MRLIDKILNNKTAVPEIQHKITVPDKDTITFIADGIAKTIDEIDENDITEVINNPSARAYGAIPPPFPSFFIETQKNNITVYDGKSLDLERGVMVNAFDLKKDGDIDAYLSNLSKSSQRHVMTTAVLPGARWVYVVSGFIYVSRTIKSFKSGVTFMPVEAFVSLDEDGYAMNDNGAIPTIAPDERFKVYSATIVTFLPFMFMALSFLHERGEVSEEKPSRQLRRSMKRRNDVELKDKYYQLKVTGQRPFSRDRGYGNSGKSKGLNRHHSVRGHFRYYSEDAPLFGRTTGMVWVPAHTRGNRGRGSVDKDYVLTNDE